MHFCFRIIQPRATWRFFIQTTPQLTDGYSVEIAPRIPFDILPQHNLMSFWARLGWQVNRFSICVAQLFDSLFDFYFFFNSCSPFIGFCLLLNYPKNTFPFFFYSICYYSQLHLHPVKFHPRKYLEDLDYCSSLCLGVIPLPRTAFYMFALAWI